MSVRRFVIQETIANPGELRTRFRGTRRGRALVLPQRPQLSTGDHAQVMLTVRATGARVQVSGHIGRTDLPMVLGRRSSRSYELLLDEPSQQRLKPVLFDNRRLAPRPRRAGRRQAMSRHSDWRFVRDAHLRDGQILDASPRGLFLASSGALNPGDTIFVRPAETSPWLAGMVRWKGAKFGHDGVGIHIVFSREDERQAWNDWYVRAELDTRG